MNAKDPKELGVPNINFSVELDDSYSKERLEEFKQQRIERGFDDTETWNLEYVIAQFILPRLKRFKELTNGYPVGMKTMENWYAELDKMIEAFQLYAADASSCLDKDVEQKVQAGLDSFAKYFFHLWW